MGTGVLNIDWQLLSLSPAVVTADHVCLKKTQSQPCTSVRPSCFLPASALCQDVVASLLDAPLLPVKLPCFPHTPPSLVCLICQVDSLGSHHCAWSLMTSKAFQVHHLLKNHCLLWMICSSSLWQGQSSARAAEGPYRLIAGLLSLKGIYHSANVTDANSGQALSALGKTVHAGKMLASSGQSFSGLLLCFFSGIMVWLDFHNFCVLEKCVKKGSDYSLYFFSQYLVLDSSAYVLKHASARLAIEIHFSVSLYRWVQTTIFLDASLHLLATLATWFMLTL